MDLKDATLMFVSESADHPAVATLAQSAYDRLAAGEEVDYRLLNDRLAREVIDGVLAGEGTPDQVVEKRGLAVVSDDSALLSAIDEAVAANPDVAEKVRAGKVQAAGVIVGAVMKATRGKADAARVRELIIERLSS